MHQTTVIFSTHNHVGIILKSGICTYTTPYKFRNTNNRLYVNCFIFNSHYSLTYRNTMWWWKHKTFTSYGCWTYIVIIYGVLKCLACMERSIPNDPVDSSDSYRKCKQILAALPEQLQEISSEKGCNIYDIWVERTPQWLLSAPVKYLPCVGGICW